MFCLYHFSVKCIIKENYFPPYGPLEVYGKVNSCRYILSYWVEYLLETRTVMRNKWWLFQGGEVQTVRADIFAVMFSFLVNDKKAELV